MSHPSNKNTRRALGILKGYQRAHRYWNGKEVTERDIYTRRDTSNIRNHSKSNNPRRLFKDKTLQEKKFEQSLTL